MIVRGLTFLFAAAALVSVAAPAAALPASDTSAPTVCSKPRYPHDSLKRMEEGVSLLGFLVRADGTVGRTLIVSSSGSADLDTAAADALAECVFKPSTSTDGGKAVESWVAVQYVWSIGDETEMSHAKHDMAIAARKGKVAARYNLSLLILLTAKTDVEREQALVVLRSAADLGHPHAQFDLGRRYEKGEGMKADIEEALRWYQKAAAQGDVFAIQRLQVGAL
jgi:TonB family protein